jgi:RNA polymerase sigma-54 factor
MARALSAVQVMLEPAGIGARDVRECLLLQIDEILRELLAPETSQISSMASSAEEWLDARRLIDAHLDDLSQNRLPKVADRSGLALERVKRAIERMRSLRLAPGRELSPAAPAVIVPDAVIEFDEENDRYIAYMADSRLPALRLNREYALMAKDRSVDKSTREFLRNNIASATWLIDAVEQRRRTLLRVIDVILRAQRDYFDYGPQSLRPLPMTQVADELGLHVATVSRAVADKFVMTPRGVVPLRGFFTGGTQTGEGEDISWDAVKAALREVIDAEDKSKPLSDEALAEEIGRRGIDIARRTVAKYREQMGIPPARLRKTY